MSRYDILLKQSVGTEDLFMGLSGKDPSSMCCEALLVIFFSSVPFLHFFFFVIRLRALMEDWLFS